MLVTTDSLLCTFSPTSPTMFSDSHFTSPNLCLSPYFTMCPTTDSSSSIINHRSYVITILH